MIDTLLAWLKHLSRICGLETADSFPPGHPHARTRWNGACFDIASDVKPEQIERLLCEAIANTPLAFGYISHPTPAMQRALMAVLEERARRRIAVGDLGALMIAAYDSPHTMEAVPGLRAEIERTRDDEMPDRVRSMMAFLRAMQSPFDVIEMRH